jgi:hypothetical protein
MNMSPNKLPIIACLLAALALGCVCIGAMLRLPTLGYGAFALVVATFVLLAMCLRGEEAAKRQARHSTERSQPPVADRLHAHIMESTFNFHQCYALLALQKHRLEEAGFTVTMSGPPPRDAEEGAIHLQWEGSRALGEINVWQSLKWAHVSLINLATDETVICKDAVLLHGDGASQLLPLIDTALSLK